MKLKVLRVLVFLVFSLILFSVMVLAKGSYSYSTGDIDSKDAKECNGLSTMKERIQCRFDNGGAAEVPEACDGLDVQDDCIEFYDKAGYCYDIDNSMKKACFKDEAGYAKDPSEDNKRWYVVALFYELQEYVEDDFDAGKLDSEQTADWISDIIEMKRMVMAGDDLSEVKEKLEVYRNERNI